MSADMKIPAESEKSSNDAARDVLDLGSKSAPKKAKKWMIRGVPADIREMATKAAKESGKTIGELVAEAIAAHVPTLENEALDERDPLVELDALAHDVEERLVEIEGRMKTVEAEDRLYRLVERPWIREVS